MNEAKSTKRIVLHGQVPGSTSTLVLSRATNIGGVPRVYLLSPAHAGGKRAQMLFQSSAQFELAVRLRSGGVSIGEAFSFMSPLYFRGKLTYAKTFASPPVGIPAVMMITPCRGLVPPESIVGLSDMEEIAREQVLLDNPKYRDPLERDLGRLSEAIGPRGRIIFLGSIATDKYIPVLAGKLGERLLVPREFVGLGNMSRGALLLRCSREKCELEYISVTELL